MNPQHYIPRRRNLHMGRRYGCSRYACSAVLHAKTTAIRPPSLSSLAISRPGRAGDGTAGLRGRQNSTRRGLTDMTARAYFYLSPALMMDALHLPSGTKICAVEWDHVARAIRVFVDHPTFVNVPDHEPLPKVMPTIFEACDRESPRRVERTYSSVWRTA